MVFLETACTLLLLVCLAGVVYPFKPFRSRKMAILGAVLVFAGSITVFGIHTASPEYVEKWQEVAKPELLSAREKVSGGDIDGAVAVLDGMDYRATTEAQDEVDEIRGLIAKERAVIDIEQITGNTELGTQEKLKEILNVWRSLDKIPDARKALAPELEPLLLSLIKPVPASDRNTNRLGYELLDEVNRRSNSPTDMYKAKAKQYAIGDPSTDTPAESCEASNYKFIHQTKLQLRDPGSFEPGRVYKGQKRGDGTQYVYMDYRAKNGFGGINASTAKGIINLTNCKFTLLSVE